MKYAAHSLAVALLGLSGLAASAADTTAQLQAGLKQVRLSLSEAIDAAQTAVAGRSIDAQLDIDKGTAHYDVEIITPQGSHIEVQVNASTGAAVKQKNNGLLSHKDKQQLEASKISLKQAIEAALQHTPGTAVEADLSEDWGRVVFAVDVLTAAGKRIEIKINPEDGSVLSSKDD